MRKKSSGRGWLIVIVLIAAIAGGGYAAWRELGRRYDVLTTAAEQALNKGDAAAAARLLLAATQGRHLAALHFDNAKADGLLLEALLRGRPILAPSGTRQFPEFTITGDVVPMNATISDDGTKLMILHNEKGQDWTYDIYDVASGKQLVQFPSDASNHMSELVVAGFSPDLNTTIINGADGPLFRDTLTGKPVLPDFEISRDFYPVTISNDRKRITGHGDNVFRIWDLSGAQPKVHDFQPGKDVYMDDPYLSPDGSVFVIGGGNRTKDVRDAKTNAVRLSLQSLGTVDFAFTPDNRFMVSSRVPNAPGGGYEVQVWNAATFRAEGPALPPGDFVTGATVVQGRVLALGSFTGLRFWDTRTHRIIATAPDIVSMYGQSPALNGQKVYTISMTHILTTYDLDPLFAMSDKALAVQACARWGKDAGLKLTATEVARTRARIAIDPCPTKS